MPEDKLKGSDKDNKKSDTDRLREDRERYNFIKDHSFEKRGVRILYDILNTSRGRTRVGTNTVTGHS
jgi:hypothetical protein